MELYHQPEETKHPISLSVTSRTDAVLQQSRNSEVEEDEGVATQAVLDLLAKAQRQQVQRRQVMLKCLGGTALVLASFAFVPHSSLAIFHYVVSVFSLVFLIALFSLQYRATTQALAQVDDVRMVGPLIDRLPVGRKRIRTRRLVRQALMRLLPRLQASDASLLTPGQKGTLARRLAHLALFQRDKEFQVVILRALEQVGDAQAIPVVESLVQREAHWTAQEQVHAAAAECLPFLLQRAQEETARQTLLRAASQEVEEDGALLLRPAQGAGAIRSEELLRAD